MNILDSVPGVYEMYVGRRDDSTNTFIEFYFTGLQVAVIEGRQYPIINMSFNSIQSIPPIDEVLSMEAGPSIYYLSDTTHSSIICVLRVNLHLLPEIITSME